MGQRDGLKIKGKFHDGNHMKRIFQKECRSLEYHSTAEGGKITMSAFLAPIPYLPMHPYSLLCDFTVYLIKVDGVFFPFVFIWPSDCFGQKKKV